MFDVDWSKLLVIGAVTLIVLAPRMQDAVGRWTDKIRRAWS